MKGVKKAAKLGIRWKLITYFALFVAVILVLLWLFQTVFLDSFYKAIKTRNAQACGDSIVSKINSPNLGDYINELALFIPTGGLLLDFSPPQSARRWPAAFKSFG